MRAPQTQRLDALCLRDQNFPSEVNVGQPLVYTYDASASTSARSFFLRVCLRRPGSHVAYACACVVPVRTWLMLVLASSRFARGLCLCLRRPGSHVAYACACIVPVRTWLMLVLASSRFARGLCLCLHRTCKPAFSGLLLVSLSLETSGFVSSGRFVLPSLFCRLTNAR